MLVQYAGIGNIRATVKWAIYVYLICLPFFSLEAVNAQENISNFIVIDGMRTLNGWNCLTDGNKSSANISLVEDGLKISYDLKEPGSWVDIYKEIDLSNIIKLSNVDGINKLTFYFQGNGSPNSFELKLEYDDSATFGYKRSGATDTNGILDSFVLDPWQISYWWGGRDHTQREVVDFSKVKKMRFAISNDPERDAPGKGYVIIKQVTARTNPLSPTLYEQYKDVIIAIIGLIAAAIGGYWAGKRDKESTGERDKESTGKTAKIR
jgi:hypothetical protein